MMLFIQTYEDFMACLLHDYIGAWSAREALKYCYDADGDYPWTSQVSKTILSTLIVLELLFLMVLLALLYHLSHMPI